MAESGKPAKSRDAGQPGGDLIEQLAAQARAQHYSCMRELKYITTDSLLSFLRSWYGEPDRKVAEVDFDIPIPSPLRDWYRLTNKWSAKISRYNRFLAPEDLYEHDGKLVFWKEDEGARDWGIGPIGEDPVVYESDDVLGRWESTGFRLSKFLLYVAVSEAVHGDPNVLSV